MYTKLTLKLLPAAVLGAVAAVSCGVSAAQKYPERPIRLIVQSPAGGTADLIARVVAHKVSEALGQSIVADNRGGAAGTLSAEMTANASPDGYTLLVVGAPPLSISVTLRAGKLSYDPRKDFTFVSLIGKVPLGISMLPSFPAKNFKEFIAYAKSRPGKINYGSAGTGSTNHLTAELLKVETGIDITHIPFKGGAPAMAALLANQIEVYVATVPTIVPMVKAGRIRAVAVSSSKRTAALPDVPTIAESGVPGFELTSWFCVVGPKGIPKPILARLNSEIVKALGDAETSARLSNAGVNVEPSTPEELRTFVLAEIQKMGRAVKASGLKIE